MDNVICKIDGCDKYQAVRGMCHGHYKKFIRYGDPLGGSDWADNSGPCSVDGCEKHSHARGFCAAHYYHFRKRGDPSKKAPKKTSRVMEWLLSHVDHEDEEECLTWPFSTNIHGRASMRLRGKTSSAYREMCRLAHGEPDSDVMHAAHSCGKGHLGCINPNHLRWDTPKGNEADKVLHGTSNRGESHGLSKLTVEQVYEIRSMHGMATQREVAIKFGVSQGHVADIWNRRVWRWLA